MILYIICMVCGILFAQSISHLPNYSVVLKLLGLACLSYTSIIIYAYYFLRNDTNNKMYFYVCKISTCLLIAFIAGIYAILHALWLSNWSLPKELINQNISVIGYIDSLPIQEQEYTKFKFYTEEINHHPQKTILLLNWYEKNQTRPKIYAGDKWQLIVKLKPPHATYNPGEFDYEQYLWQQRIRATGYVVTNFKNLTQETNHKISLSTNRSVKNFILTWRQNIKNTISLMLPNQPLVNMLYALVLGDQSEVTAKQWDVLRLTGTTYLLAIAGLHICLMAGVVFFCVYFLWCRSRRLMLYLPASKIASVFGLCGGVFYSIISGFSIPTQRALFMLSIFTIVKIGKMYFTVWQVLFFAMFLILIFDPLAVLSLGFWLSFIAMGIIFYINTGRLQLSNNYWHKYLRMQGAITLGLIPFTLNFFSQASFMTIIANVFAMPGVCLLIVPLGLLGSFLLFITPVLAKYILLLSEKLLEYIWFGLDFLSQTSILNYHQAVFAWWQIALAIIGVMIILAPKGFFNKSIGIMWFMPLMFYMPKQPSEHELWFYVLDVGQGLATVIQTKNHVLVYDTGPKSLSDSDAGERILVPFLQQLGIKKIDTLVVSHGDDDHIGGAKSLLQSFSVENILTSVPDKFGYLQNNKEVFGQNILAKNCYAGQTWNFDGIDFIMLHPQQNTEYIGNGSSCVLKINNGINSILLTGDIEKKQEKFITNIYANTSILQANILIAPHHGSKTSSSKEFIAQINPQYVIFPVGFYNRFHFPSFEIVERYKQYLAKTYETQQTGMVFFKIFPNVGVVKPEFYRDIKPHYWMSAIPEFE